MADWQSPRFRCAQNAREVPVSDKVSKSLTLSRRRLVQATGGIAAGAALAGSFGMRPNDARAQDATTITIWSNHPEWQDQILALIAAFETENPDIKFELTSIPGQDYPTKLQTA